TPLRRASRRLRSIGRNLSRVRGLRLPVAVAMLPAFFARVRAIRARGRVWLRVDGGGDAVPMPVSTWVEVDLDRLVANLETVREAAGPASDLLLVVKADAYGHGAVEIAEAAAEAQVAYLGVATLHEGIQLRQSGSALPIVALSPLLLSE